MNQSSARKPVSRLKPTRIILVDDHPLIRERLADILNHEPDLTVCGEAEDRYGALEAVRKQQPDLVLADLTLKASDGLELIKDLYAAWPKLPVLVVSMHDESLYAERVIRAGARGYITKQEATRNILAAVRRVLAGGIYVNEKAATRLVTRLSGGARSRAATPDELLTDRELQVFELTGYGLNTLQIGVRLHIGPKTVETYRARIREKLELKDANELLQRAISWAHQP